MYNFNEQIENDSKKFGYTSGNIDYFNIEPGNDNVCRILTPSVAYASHFLGKGIKSPVCYGYDKGCPIREKEEDGTLSTRHARGSIKYVLYVLDRKDNKVKAAFFPYGVVWQVGAIQQNPDFQFSELPMPYDIRITYKPDEKDPKAKYRVEVKPNSAELTQQNLDDVETKDTSPEQIVEKMKQKQLDNDERNGRRVEQTTLVAEQEAFMKKAQAENPSVNVPQEKVIEYPKDEINPEDIPF